ncbi:MAG: protein kinase family protein [Gammaproteobacteria bacterium]|nr:protein kinase family protein [Gammaproteobacteria bacterium]
MVANLTVIDKNSLTTGELIGSGSFGHCFICKVQPSLLPLLIQNKLCEEGSDTIVMKQCIALSNKVRASFVEEGRIGDKLRHAFINSNNQMQCPVNLVSVCNYDNEPAILSRIESQGNCVTYLTKKSIDPNIDAHNMCINIMKDLYNSMEFLHANNILHLDIALRNFLINGDDKAILCDFGNSIEIESGINFVDVTTKFIPYLWADTNIIRLGYASRTSDLFSLKITMLEVMATLGGINHMEIFGSDMYNQTGYAENVKDNNSINNQLILQNRFQQLNTLLSQSQNIHAKPILNLLNDFKTFLTASFDSSSNEMMTTNKNNFLNACDESIQNANTATSNNKEIENPRNSFSI